MDEVSKSIAASIESGQYFEDTKIWYLDKYITPFSERLYTFILFVILAVIVFTTGLFVEQSYKSNKRGFPIKVSNQYDYASIIKPISKKSEPLNISISRYLISDYVMNREEYIPARIDSEVWLKKISKVEKLSSRRVFSRYLNYLDSRTNVNSPFTRYKTHTSRKIEIVSIKFNENSEKADFAKVKFKATEKSKDQEKVSKWIAEVSFNISSIEKIFKSKLPLEFIVTDYTISQIK